MFSLTIKKKLLLALVGISIIPIIFLGLIFNIQSRRSIISKISIFSNKTVVETASHLANKFAVIQDTMDEIMITDQVQDNMDKFSTYGALKRNEISLDINSIIFRNYGMVKYLSFFEILTIDDFYFYDYGYLTTEKVDYSHSKERLMKLGGKVYYEIMDNKKEIFVGRVINKNFTLRPMGYMVMSIREKYFSEVYKGLTEINEGIELMMMDRNGCIMSSNKNELNGEVYKHTDILNRIFTNKSNYFSEYIGAKEYLISYSPIENTDYYLVCLIPYSYLNEETYNLDRLVLLIVISCASIAIIVSIILTKAIFNPINRLVDVMKQAKKGNLSMKLNYYKRDEIGYLADNFNDMLHQINELIIKLEAEEKEKREAELNMLQAQINPHFLFNVLNSLKWTAMMSQSYSVSDGIDALANLLRDTINNKNEFITLEKEIENISHYIVIQRIRYGESFELKCNLSKDMLKCKIPKLLLQPLVENSIIHGFDNIDYIGIITITGVIEEDTLILEISDNGRGLNDSVIESIKSSSYKSKKQLSSIGIHNVEQRIKLHYGRQYGLVFENYSKGTKVTLRICYKV